MASHINEKREKKIAIINSIWSSVYMFLTLFALYYTKKLYDVGTATCLPLIALLAIGEFLKSMMRHFITDHSSVRERSKTKKFNLYILFGAPFLTAHEQTFMFSLLLTVLTTVPACIQLGADNAISLLIDLTSFDEDVITESLRVNICGTLFGAWMGAILIPLDWDRPWQVWPIPCSIGSMIGYIISNVFVIAKFSPKFEKVLIKKSSGKYGL
ncbi:hypothetical protein FQA39_LY16667 [Lamprigera yunnana]|nr:hypothetical protein FQA39_LY16667 [Lamprigera yunnana]